MSGEQASFDGWAVLELMGHKRLGGHVQDVILAGVGMWRIDVPASGPIPAVTQYYAPGAVYCLTPCTEELACAVASDRWSAPELLLEVPRLAAPREEPAEHPDYDDRMLTDDMEDV